jgi:broad specificity phosphatase PhoE
MRAALALVVLLAALPAGGSAPAQDRPAFQDRLSGPALVEALRGGGHVIFIRHTRTEREGADQVSAVMGDCATQRMLSEAGWREARAIGAGFAALGIPVAAVISSEYCRAWQTADLAFGRHVKDPALNFEKAETYTEAQLRAMRDRVRPLLATMPPRGHNTVLVGHDDPFEAATGLYPEPMGVGVVIRLDGSGGFELLADLRPEEWLSLAAGR